MKGQKAKTIVLKLHRVVNELDLSNLVPYIMTKQNDERVELNEHYCPFFLERICGDPRAFFEYKQTRIRIASFGVRNTKNVCCL